MLLIDQAEFQLSGSAEREELRAQEPIGRWQLAVHVTIWPPLLPWHNVALNARATKRIPAATNGV